MTSKLVVIGLLCGLTAAVPAQAEMWTCTYDGTWDNFGGTAQESFNWHVVWQSTSGNEWNVTGDYSDHYGESVLNGACDDESCLLHQVYNSGELEGKEYYWKGEYEDEKDGNNTINTFTGTWGTTTDASDGGTWKAIATCVPN